VDAYYQAGVRGRLTDFAPYLDPDFSTTAPNYLPWAVCLSDSRGVVRELDPAIQRVAVVGSGPALSTERPAPILGD
jgi:hypothetical protein